MQKIRPIRFLPLMLLLSMLLPIATVSAQPSYRARQERLLGQSNESKSGGKTNIILPKEQPQVRDVNAAERLNALRSAFSGERTGSPIARFLLTFVLVSAITAGVTYWYVTHYVQERQKRDSYDDPQELFRELCRVHEIRREESQLLRRMADELELETVLLLFVEPSYYETALNDPRFHADSSLLYRLRSRLFGRIVLPHEPVPARELEQVSSPSVDETTVVHVSSPARGKPSAQVQGGQTESREGKEDFGGRISGNHPPGGKPGQRKPPGSSTIHRYRIEHFDGASFPDGQRNRRPVSQVTAMAFPMPLPQRFFDRFSETTAEWNDLLRDGARLFKERIVSLVVRKKKIVDRLTYRPERTSIPLQEAWNGKSPVFKGSSALPVPEKPMLSLPSDHDELPLEEPPSREGVPETVVLLEKLIAEPSPQSVRMQMPDASSSTVPLAAHFHSLDDLSNLR